MIYVTHDQIEAMTLADRIVLLKDGQIEQQGAPLDLFERPADPLRRGLPRLAADELHAPAGSSPTAAALQFACRTARASYCRRTRRSPARSVAKRPVTRRSGRQHVADARTAAPARAIVAREIVHRADRSRPARAPTSPSGSAATRSVAEVERARRPRAGPDAATIRHRHEPRRPDRPGDRPGTSCPRHRRMTARGSVMRQPPSPSVKLFGTEEPVEPPPC